MPGKISECVTMALPPSRKKTPHKKSVVDEGPHSELAVSANTSLWEKGVEARHFVVASATTVDGYSDSCLNAVGGYSGWRSRCSLFDPRSLLFDEKIFERPGEFFFCRLLLTLRWRSSPPKYAQQAASSSKGKWPLRYRTDSQPL